MRLLWSSAVGIALAFTSLLAVGNGGVRGDIVAGESVGGIGDIGGNQTLDETDNDDGRPSEVQKAVCTVTAGEVRASAEAVTTKTLKGVCGSAELQAAFRDLETRLYRELSEIKMLLLMLQQQPQQQQQQMPHATNCGNNIQTTLNNNNNYRNHIKMQPTTNSATTIPVSTTPTPTITTTTSTTTTPTPAPFTVSTGAGKKAMPKLKSLPNGGPTRSAQLPQREQEVHRFNNTLLTDRELKIFTYYWKLENFSQHLQSNEANDVESPIFAVKGKTLHIKAHFHHMRRELLYLQLEEAQLSSNNRHNIILDTGSSATAASAGGLFKAIVSKKITFKHKISILDQQQKHGKDLASQELNNMEMGFLIPHSALLDSPYVKDNSLLIQIFLYL